ncbi:hypothetical protein JCM11491_004183 [Sporobolomyces phaffii]
MTSHSTPAAPGTTSRRRLSSRRLARPEGEGESSREASAESNDETLSGQSDGDITDSSSFALPVGLAGASGQRPNLSHQPVSSSLQIDPIAAKQGITGGLGGLNLNSSTVPHAAPRASRPAPVGTDASTTEGEDDGGSASGHDGDISSAPAPSASLGARLTSQQAHVPRAPVNLPPSSLHHHHHASSSASSSVAGGDNEVETEGEVQAEVPETAEGERKRDTEGEVLWAAAPKGFLSNLSAEEIQEHIRSAISGQAGRAYKINPPPVGRPVRIYADGVYDLLHYGHMLQLRQCKLAFPSVHLLVGCCSSELVREHKAQPVMHSEERYESLRHLKWVDEVVENAPWTVDKEFIEKWQIDYVAHDEEPYVSAGSQDVYAYAKSIGAFLPTKRTNGVSTSELLQRIVEGYREGDYDGKLRKIGHPELCSRQGSEAGTGYGSARKE